MKIAYLTANTEEEKAEAERIREILVYAREQAGYTQKDMGKLLNTSQAAYHHIEHDFKRSNSYMQEKICEILYLPKPKIFEKGL